MSRVHVSPLLPALAQIAQENGRVPSGSTVVLVAAAPKGQAIVAEKQAGTVLCITGFNCGRRAEITVGSDFVGGLLAGTLNESPKLGTLGRESDHGYTVGEARLMRNAAFTREVMRRP